MKQRLVVKRKQIDKHVIDACLRGDRAAFHLLFEQYKDSVYSIAFYHTGNEELARDITQQVFLKLFTSFEQFRYEADFTTWLYRVVVNACLDDCRKRKRFLPFYSPEIRSIESKDSLEESYFRKQVTAAVKAAVSRLTPKLKMPILLKYVEGLSYDEIAEVLGCSKGTVASRLNRGHKILSKTLEYLRGVISDD